MPALPYQVAALSFLSLLIWLPTLFKHYTEDMFQPYDTLTIDNQSALWALILNPDLDNTCYDENGTSLPPLFNLSDQLRPLGTGVAYTCPSCDAPRPGYKYVDFFFSVNVKFTFDYRRYPLDTQEVCGKLMNLSNELNVGIPLLL